VKAARRFGLDDISEKAAAFRNQQAMIGREQGSGYSRFHRHSSVGRGGTDRSKQARVDFLSLGLGNGRAIGSRFDMTRRRSGQGLLQHAIEKRPCRPGLPVIEKHTEQSGFQPAHLARRRKGSNPCPVLFFEHAAAAPSGSTLPESYPFRLPPAAKESGGADARSDQTPKCPPIGRFTDSCSEPIFVISRDTLSALRKSYPLRGA
jgi:hypothetical protein